ncbi:hypothetical protein T07_12466 [Trichinella nelsoni]|uniref:Uncharacterized protein n=1 Tax=Trichinella nelsoni TaxID=6336 RepID=A0A0V0RSJ9_9BILA|nr:hypothetical protein T07_12466 [Trichinella nelsoni]
MHGILLFDDKRELAVLVGREPAGRGLSSPGTALALSAATLTEAASLTNVAASLDEPAALSATPSFAMSAYVRRLRSATFTLFSVAVSSSLLLFFRRLGIVTCTAAAVVDRRPGNDQFVQLISFISGYYVSDHAAYYEVLGDPAPVGILPLSQFELASLRTKTMCCIDHGDHMKCQPSNKAMLFHSRTQSAMDTISTRAFIASSVTALLAHHFEKTQHLLAWLIIHKCCGLPPTVPFPKSGPGKFRYCTVS